VAPSSLSLEVEGMGTLPFSALFIQLGKSLPESLSITTAFLVALASMNTGRCTSGTSESSELDTIATGRVVSRAL
jgi:hypothetical protein